MSYRLPRAFTLIELLVVVAIIGILTSVVLGSLNTARNKAQDAAVKSNLSSARGQAELYHDANANSFEDVCDSGAGVNGVKTIYPAVSAAVFAAGGVTVGSGPTTLSSGTCNDTESAWAAEAALVTGGFYCIDNVGNATTSSTSLVGAGELSCS
jgi:prepilin-type N-terminal cleavage/methylation domain-containing protein